MVSVGFEIDLLHNSEEENDDMIVIPKSGFNLRNYHLLQRVKSFERRLNVLSEEFVSKDSFINELEKYC